MAIELNKTMQTRRLENEQGQPHLRPTYNLSLSKEPHLAIFFFVSVCIPPHQKPAKPDGFPFYKITSSDAMGLGHPLLTIQESKKTGLEAEKEHSPTTPIGVGQSCGTGGRALV